MQCATSVAREHQRRVDLQPPLVNRELPQQPAARAVADANNGDVVGRNSCRLCWRQREPDTRHWCGHGEEQRRRLPSRCRKPDTQLQRKQCDKALRIFACCVGTKKLC